MEPQYLKIKKDPGVGISVKEIQKMGQITTHQMVKNHCIKRM